MSKGKNNAAQQQIKGNTAVQLSVIQSSTVVSLTQTVALSSVVTDGKVKKAAIDSKNVTKPNKVVSHTKVTLVF